MKFIIDIGSVVVEAKDRREASEIAERRIRKDPSLVEVCDVNEFCPEDHGFDYPVLE